MMGNLVQLESENLRVDGEPMIARREPIDSPQGHFRLEGGDISATLARPR